MHVKKRVEEFVKWVKQGEPPLRFQTAKRRHGRGEQSLLPRLGGGGV